MATGSAKTLPSTNTCSFASRLTGGSHHCGNTTTLDTILLVVVSLLCGQSGSDSHPNVCPPHPPKCQHAVRLVCTYIMMSEWTPLQLQITTNKHVFKLLWSTLGSSCITDLRPIRLSSGCHVVRLASQSSVRFACLLGVGRRPHPTIAHAARKRRLYNTRHQTIVYETSMA